MRRSLKKSNEQFQRAIKSLPLGVTSNFRYWGDDKTIYVKRAKGARFWDLDDNEYIDYRLGYGPAILGYANPEVDAAAREGMEVGGVFALATEREATVAERIKKMVPSVDLVRFSNSGTEAVMAALRLARAYTGKDSYIICEGGYHGMFDSVMWAANIEEMEEGKDPEIVPFGAGIPDVLRQMVNVVPMNDANRLEDLLKEKGDQIAAYLIEPIMGNCGSIMAQEEYVKAARALCTQYNVVMIIDEVKTGFRVAKGGVQELMGVDADICTFAKAVGNGYPISVLAGREDIMRNIHPDKVAHGGTYTAHSVCIAAAEKTLEILDETTALADIATYGTNLSKGITAILDKRSIAHNWVGHPSMYGLFLCEEAPVNYRDWLKTDSSLYEAIGEELHDLGIIVEPDNREPFFLSTAHDDACLAETLEKFEIAVDIVLKKN